MAEQRQADETESDAEEIPTAQRTVTPGPSGAPTKDKSTESKPLTPEEQMALYEEKLKEEDWGHQPC
jgi:hypothetical protein